MRMEAVPLRLNRISPSPSGEGLGWGVSAWRKADGPHPARLKARLTPGQVSLPLP